MYSIQKALTLFCDNNEIALFGFHIVPIYKMEYYFICLKKDNGISLLIDSHKTSELIELIREYAPTGCSLSDFLEHIAQSEAFVSEYKRRFCKYEVITDAKTLELVDKVIHLDTSIPQQPRCSGLDGYSLYCCISNQPRELRFWCYHYDKYYEPITLLGNLFLEIAGVDRAYRFTCIERNSKHQDDV